MNKHYLIKRSITYSAAIFFSLIAAYFSPFAETFWIPLTAILVMQTAIGVTVRQGVLRFIWVVGAVTISTLFLKAFYAYPMIIHLSRIFIVIGSCYLMLRHLFSRSTLLLWAMSSLIVMYLPATTDNILYARLCNVTLGAAIGIITNLIILPSKVDIEFRKNIIPILNAYADYLSSIIDLLFKKENAQLNANKKKRRVQKTLQAHTAFFPAWVYEPGFSVIYQQGHRHFLIMIERVGQILFSLHHIARHEFDMTLLQDLQKPLENYVQQTEKIFVALTTVMNLNKLTAGVSDLSEEIRELENAFNTAVPIPLELIDLSPDYILCAALIEDLKDMRITLIKLGQALRGAATPA